MNYVPWQGRDTEMPPGVYWWRVRAESAKDVPIPIWPASPDLPDPNGARSAASRFHSISSTVTNMTSARRLPPNSLLADNKQYLPALTQVATTTHDWPMSSRLISCMS